jgi:hypothetical protein
MSATATPAPAAPAAKKAREVFGRDGIYEFTERAIRNSLGKRAASGDLDALVALARLKDDIDKTMAEIAVPGLRSEEGGAYSYREIGLALGYPEESARQSAAYRFRNTDKSTAARTGGGQPADRR